MSDIAAPADHTTAEHIPEPPPASRRLPPGPRGLPWIGTAITLARDPLGFILELGHRYGPISHTRFGPYQVYMLNEPELIEDVLIGKHRLCTKDKSTRDLIPLAGNGLLTSEGEPWLRQRRLASPPLQPKRIASYAATMRECAQRAFGALRDGQELDLHALLGQVTLEIVGKTLLGVDATGEAQRDEKNCSSSSVCPARSARPRKIFTVAPDNSGAPLGRRKSRRGRMRSKRAVRDRHALRQRPCGLRMRARRRAVTSVSA